MSKCQHGEKITMFCATQCCVWKEAGGCPVCMKKYHNHMGPTVFINEEQTNKLVKKYNVQPTAKHKCRSLQEAIFNYFNIIKSQFDTFIDAACIDIMNQIGHPYLVQNNLFTTYKRLKKKDYKKIHQKDFRNFYEGSLKISDAQLYEKQSNIYLQKVKKKQQFINAIEKTIRSLQKINKDHNQSYFGNHDGSMNLRINDIIKTIIKNQQKLDESNSKKENKVSETQNKQKLDTSSNKQTNKKYFSSSERRKDSVNLVNTTIQENLQQLKCKEQEAPKKREQRQKHRPGRLSSLDKQFVKSNKLHKKQEVHDTSIGWKDKSQQKDQVDIKLDNKSPKKRYFDTKQVQINEKKQKLIDMMKNKEDSFGNKLKPYFQMKSTNKSQNKFSQKSASGLEGSGDSLEVKDDNYHFFAHTALPRTESRKKIFQEAQQVAQKTVIIPVDVQQKIQPSKIEQCQSPLMKNKFKSKQLPQKNKQLKNPPNDFSIQPSKVKSKQELMNENELDSNKEKSLALLIKSLNLKIEEAIPYLEKALYYADDNLSAAQYLSYLYLEIDRPKECLTVCNQMLEKITNLPNKKEISIHLNINKASALNMLGRYSESIVILEQSLKGKPNEKIFKNLGDAYYSIGILEKASYYYEKAVSKAENFDQAHYNLAVCLFSQQNYYNAKFSIMKALQLSPNNEFYKQMHKQIMQRIKQY